jgi:choline-glycine betaine transporter
MSCSTTFFIVLTIFLMLAKLGEVRKGPPKKADDYVIGAFLAYLFGSGRK